MKAIEDYILNYTKNIGIDLPRDEIKELSNTFKIKTFNKGEHLIMAGEKSYFMAFIVHGLVRFYFNTFEGKQVNQTFKKENDLIVDYFSALTHEPAFFLFKHLKPPMFITRTIAFWSAYTSGTEIGTSWVG